MLKIYKSNHFAFNNNYTMFQTMTKTSRGGWEFETQEKTYEEASSMLDKSFCAKPNKRVWPTTIIIHMVDQTGIEPATSSLRTMRSPN